jgi:hypothetical protein
VARGGRLGLVGSGGFCPPLSFSVLARDRFYFPIFLLFLLVISHVSNSLLWGCDAWSRSLGCRYERYPGCWVDEDKCWPGVPNPQCQEISVSLGFSALSVKE